MESSIKEQKVQAMKEYKRAKFVYNFVLYSLTSIITCFFISYPFWFPSIHHLLSSLPDTISCLLNAKCFFILGNLIVLILVGESKLKQSSSSSTSSSDTIYDEYVSRMRSRHPDVSSKEMNGSTKVEENVKEEKKECKSSRGHEEKKKGTMMMRTSKTESGKREKTKEKIGMRNCKSEIWSENEIAKREKSNGEREEEIKSKSSGVVVNLEEEKKMGMRSCKSEIWDGSHDQIINNVRKKEKKMIHEEKKRGTMRSCKSEVWGETQIAKMKQQNDDQDQPASMTKQDLNKRVEAFIARVNKQRLLEAKQVDPDTPA